MGLLDQESPLMRSLARLADLMLLNLLTALWFLPLLLCMGFAPPRGGPAGSLLLRGLLILSLLPTFPAITALHGVSLKLLRGEEGYLLRDFFRSLQRSFLPSAALGGLLLLAASALVLDFRILGGGGGPALLRLPLVAAAVLLFLTALWVFPIEAHFEGTLREILKNAFLSMLLAFPRTLGMALCALLPPAVCLVLGWRALPLVALFGLSVPAYGMAALYDGVFRRFE